MIQLFEARKKQKVEDNELLEKYLKISKQEKEEKKPEIDKQLDAKPEV